MSGLLDVAELEHAAGLVVQEATILLHYAQLEYAKVDAARANDNPAAERAALHRLAQIARRLTRAQAVLVHRADDRWHAAQAVIGYCDEADARERPWDEPVPPVTLGAVA